MKKTKFFKKSIASILCLVMILSLWQPIVKAESYASDDSEVQTIVENDEIKLDSETFNVDEIDPINEQEIVLDTTSQNAEEKNLIVNEEIDQSSKSEKTPTASEKNQNVSAGLEDTVIPDKSGETEKNDGQQGQEIPEDLENTEVPEVPEALEKLDESYGPNYLAEPAKPNVEDHEKPVLEYFEISCENDNDTKETKILAKAKAYDIDSSINYFRVDLSTDDGYSEKHIYLHKDENSSEPNLFIGDTTFQNAPEVEMHVNYIYIEDAAGNVADVEYKDENGCWIYSVSIGFKENNDKKPTVTEVSIPNRQFNILKDRDAISSEFYFKVDNQGLDGQVVAIFKDEFNRQLNFDFNNYNSSNGNEYAWDRSISNYHSSFEVGKTYTLTLEEAYFRSAYGKYDLDISAFNSKQITFEYDESHSSCYAGSLELLLNGKSIVGETVTPGQNIDIQLKIDKEKYHLPDTIDISFYNNRTNSRKYTQLIYNNESLMYTGSLSFEDTDESTEWSVSNVSGSDEYYYYHIYNNGNESLWENTHYFYLKSSGEFIEQTKNITIYIADNNGSTRIFQGEAPTTFTLEKLGIKLPSFKCNKQGDEQTGWFCNGKKIDEKSIIHCKSGHLNIYRLYDKYYLNIYYNYINTEGEYVSADVSIPFSKYNPSKEEVIKAINDNKPKNYMEDDAAYGKQVLKINDSIGSNVDLRYNENRSYCIESEFEKGDIYSCDLISLNQHTGKKVILPKNLSFSEVQEQLAEKIDKPNDYIEGVTFQQWNFVPDSVHENVIHVKGHAQYDRNVMYVNYKFIDKKSNEKNKRVLVEFESANPEEQNVNDVLLANIPIEDILDNNEYGDIIITPDRDISNLKINNGDYNLNVKCGYANKDFIAVELRYLANYGMTYTRQIVVYDKNSGDEGIQKALENVALPLNANDKLKFTGWILDKKDYSSYKSGHATYEGYNLVVNYHYINDKNQYEDEERIITFNKPNPTEDEIKDAIDSQVLDNLKEATGAGEGYWKSEGLLSDIDLTNGADYILVNRTYDGVELYQYNLKYNSNQAGYNNMSGAIYLPNNLSNDELTNIFNEQIVPEDINSKLKFKGWDLDFNGYDNWIYGDAIYETYYLNVHYKYISENGIEKNEHRTIELATNKISEKDVQALIDKNAPKDIPNNKEYGKQTWKTQAGLNDMEFILENGFGYIYVENSYENVAPYYLELNYIDDLSLNFDTIIMFLKKNLTLDEIKEIVNGIEHPKCENNNLTFIGWDVKEDVADHPGYNPNSYICTAKYDKTVLRINYDYIDENLIENQYSSAEIINPAELNQDNIYSIIVKNAPKNTYKDDNTGDLSWRITRDNIKDSMSIINVNVQAEYSNQDYYNISKSYYADHGRVHTNEFIFVPKNINNNELIKYIEKQPMPEDSVTDGGFIGWEVSYNHGWYNANAIYSNNLIELHYKYAVNENDISRSTIVKVVDFDDYTDENVLKVVKENVPDVYQNETYGGIKYKIIPTHRSPDSLEKSYDISVNYEQGEINEYHMEYVKDDDLGYLTGYILAPENIDQTAIESLLKERIKCPKDSTTKATYTGWVLNDMHGPGYNNFYYLTATYKEVFVIYMQYDKYNPKVAYIDVFDNANKAVVLDELPGIGKIHFDYNEEYFKQNLKDNGKAYIYFNPVEEKHVHKPIFVDGHDATCVEEGVLPHYECECGKNFEDKECTEELTDIVIPVNPDAHKFGEPTVEWSEDGKSCTAIRKCEYAPEEHVETAKAKVTSKVTKEPTSVDKGQTTYTAVFKESWASNLEVSVTKADIPAKGYEWDNVNYEWSDDLKTCTATRKELNGSDKVEEETVKVKAKQTKAPTCLLNGTTTYTANFKSDWCKGEVSRSLDNIPATGHNWSEPEYTWSADGTTCTAQRICKNNNTHAEREVVTAIKEVSKNPTCNEEGATTYTAVFNLDWATNQSITKNDISSLGHSWSAAQYTWSADGSSCTATRTCNNDSRHVETATGRITSSVTKAATCDEMGETTYVASFPEGWAYGSSVTKVDIPATGHKWKATQYTWSNNRKSCVATRICKNDSSHKETVFATVTVDETERETKYTASFDVNWAKDQTSKVKKEEKRKTSKKDIKRKPTPPGVKLSEDKIDDVVNEIKDAIKELEKASAGDGTTVKPEIKVDMGNATVVPKEILEAAKGKDITVKLDKGDYTWEINGKDILASNLDEINLEVKFDTEDIPPVTVEKLAGDKPVKQLSLTHEGDFGFKATLSINMGNEYAGQFGSLYYYDSDHKMVYIDSGKIMEDGSIQLDFSHASEYIVVVSETEMTQEDVDEELQPLNVEEEIEQIEETAGTNIMPIIVLFIILICVIAIVVIIKKRKNN